MVGVLWYALDAIKFRVERMVLAAVGIGAVGLAVAHDLHGVSLLAGMVTAAVPLVITAMAGRVWRRERPT